MSRRKKTPEECYEAMSKYAQEHNLIESGEHLAQCQDPYPECWFWSDKCRLYTTSGNDIRILPPEKSGVGIKKKDGTYPKYEYRYTWMQDGVTKHVTQQKLMSEYFLTDEFKDILPDDTRDIHHKTARADMTDATPEEINSIDNLQLLPKSIHTKLTHKESYLQGVLDTMKKLEADQQSEDREFDHFCFSDDLLKKIAKEALQGKQGVIYESHKNADGTVSQTATLVNGSDLFIE